MGGGLGWLVIGALIAIGVVVAVAYFIAARHD